MVHFAHVGGDGGHNFSFVFHWCNKIIVYKFLVLLGF